MCIVITTSSFFNVPSQDQPMMCWCVPNASSLACQKKTNHYYFINTILHHWVIWLIFFSIKWLTDWLTNKIDMIRRRIYLQIYQLDKEASQSKCLSAVLWIISLEWGPHLHLCPEMHAVTKMANLMKFHQIKWMFMVLTILTNCTILLTVCTSGHISIPVGNCTNIKLTGE